MAAIINETSFDDSNTKKQVLDTSLTLNDK